MISNIIKYVVYINNEGIYDILMWTWLCLYYFYKQQIFWDTSLINVIYFTHFVNNYS